MHRDLMASLQRQALGSTLDGFPLHDDDIPIIHQVKVHFDFKLHTAAKPNRALLELTVSGLTSFCTAQCGSPSNFISAGFSYLTVLNSSGMFLTATQHNSEVQAIDPNWAAEADRCHYQRKDTWQHSHVSWVHVDYGDLGRSVRVKVVLRPRWTNDIVLRFQDRVKRKAFATLVKTQGNPMDELQRLKTSIEGKASSSSDTAMRNLTSSLKTFVAALNPDKDVRTKLSLDPRTKKVSRTTAEQARVGDVMRAKPVTFITRPSKSKEVQERNSEVTHSKRTNGQHRVQERTASLPLAGPSKTNNSSRMDFSDGSDDEYLPLAQTRPSRASVCISKNSKTKLAPPPDIVEASGVSTIESDSDNEPLVSRRPFKRSHPQITPQNVYPTPPATPQTPQAAIQPTRSFRTLGMPNAFISPPAPYFPLDRLWSQTPSRNTNHVEHRATPSPSPERMVPIFRPDARSITSLASRPVKTNDSNSGIKRPATATDNVETPMGMSKKPRLTTPASPSMSTITTISTPQSKAIKSVVYTPRHLPTPTELHGYLQTLCNDVLANPDVWDTLSQGTRQELKREFPAFGMMKFA